MSVLLMASLLCFDFRVPIHGVLGGFHQATRFPLRDSLPALGGGLSNLEAFKLTLDSTAYANPDRSLWIDDSIRNISLEYVTTKTPFDSVVLLVWTSHGLMERRSLRTREAAWNIRVNRGIQGWDEVVGVFASYPKVLTFRSTDSSVRLFEPVDGKVLHAVSGRYRNHRERFVSPDTVYPIPEPVQDTRLLARGNALAIVNPALQSRRLRIVDFHGRQSFVVSVRANSVQVYRDLLRGMRGPVLAYTRAGETFPVYREDKQDPVEFFLLAK